MFSYETITKNLSQLTPGAYGTVLLAGLLTLLMPQTHARDIKVGVVMDQSSVVADMSRDYLAGARAYFDHHNSTAGRTGMRFELIVKDDEGIPTNTVAATRELIGNPDVDVLFGYVGDAAIAAVAADAAFKRARIALYAPLSGDVVSAVPDTIFYVRPTYREEARHIVNHFQQIGISNFLILHPATPEGDKLASQIADEVVQRKLRTPSLVAIQPDLKNLSQVVQRIRTVNPQIVIMATDTITTAEFVKVFRRFDKGTSLVGFSTINHRTLMELARPDFAASTMITQVVPHPDYELTPVQNEHLRLMARYRDEPPSHLTLEGFIAAKSFVTAIVRSNATSRSAVLTALSGERRYDVGGINLVFNNSRDRGSSFVELAFLRRNGRLIQ